MKRILYIAGLGLFLFISGAAITACSGATETNQTVEVATYQCPMDCEKGKTFDKASSCSVCGMELKAVEVRSEVEHGEIETTEEQGHSH